MHDMLNRYHDRFLQHCAYLKLAIAHAWPVIGRRGRVLEWPITKVDAVRALLCGQCRHQHLRRDTCTCRQSHLERVQPRTGSGVTHRTQQVLRVAATLIITSNRTHQAWRGRTSQHQIKSNCEHRMHPPWWRNAVIHARNTRAANEHTASTRRSRGAHTGPDEIERTSKSV